MIVDGKALAESVQADLLLRVKGLEKAPRLTIIYVGQHEVIDSYVRLKRKRAEEVGIEVVVERLPENVPFKEVENIIESSAQKGAVIVQLPLPTHIDTQAVLDLVPIFADADVLSSVSSAQESPVVYSPIVFAVQTILAHYNVSLENKKIVVVGRGSLVGTPVSRWLKQTGHPHHIVTLETPEEMKHSLFSEADVIISGAGDPHFITPDMIKEGVVLLDAGTSGASGKIVGDVDPECANKASLFSPVPGGIGPLTIVGLLSNVVVLHERFASQD